MKIGQMARHGGAPVVTRLRARFGARHSQDLTRLFDGLHQLTVFHQKLLDRRFRLDHPAHLGVGPSTSAVTASRLPLDTTIFT